MEIKGIHLFLPGFSEDGSTLKIFQYNKIDKAIKKNTNSYGLAHFAFLVDTVKEAIN